MEHQGRCHCGAIRVAFETEKPLAPRACQCSFCRKHNARNVSDPEGSARLMLGPETVRYRFAEKVSDFLLCGRCGVYVGALSEIDGRLYVTLNINAFDDPQWALEPAPVSYDGEAKESRIERRAERWTPAIVQTG